MEGLGPKQTPLTFGVYQDKWMDAIFYFYIFVCVCEGGGILTKTSGIVCTDFKCRLLILCRALSVSYVESLSQKERNQ